MLQICVVGGAEENKQTAFGTFDKLFGTEPADDKMKAKMLPRVRARAPQTLAGAAQP